MEANALKPPQRPPLYKVGAFQTGLHGSRWLPRPVCRGIGIFLSRVLYRKNPEAQRAIHSNLRVVTGLEGSPLEKLCRRNINAFGRMMADYFYCTVAKPDQIRGQIGTWEGMANLEAARARGRGVIIITGHIGNWELGALILALDGLPITIVTAPEPSTELTEWRRQYRERLGIRTLAIGEDKFVFVEMMNVLRRNELLAMLVDRPLPGSGSPVELFGRPTELSSGPALLWQHTGAAVVPAFVVRSGRTRYRSFIEPEIPLEGSDAAASVAPNTQRIAARFEPVIRQHPDQWFNYVPVWQTPDPS